MFCTSRRSYHWLSLAQFLSTAHVLVTDWHATDVGECGGATATQQHHLSTIRADAALDGVAESSGARHRRSLALAHCAVGGGGVIVGRAAAVVDQSGARRGDNQLRPTRRRGGVLGGIGLAVDDGYLESCSFASTCR